MKMMMMRGWLKGWGPSRLDSFIVLINRPTSQIGTLQSQEEVVEEVVVGLKIIPAATATATTTSTTTATATVTVTATV